MVDNLVIRTKRVIIIVFYFKVGICCLAGQEGLEHQLHHVVHLGVAGARVHQGLLGGRKTTIFTLPGSQPETWWSR